MQQSGYKFEVFLSGFDEFKLKLENAPQHVAKVTYRMIDRMVNIGREKAVQEAPIDTGNLRRNLSENSRVVTMGQTFYGTIGTNLLSDGYPYPKVMEFGTKKKFFPNYKSGAMQGWFNRHGITDKNVQFLIARSIGKKGIKGKFFLKQALETVKGKMGEVMKLGMELIDSLSF